MGSARDGMRFDNRDCWIVRFEDGKSVQVRVYVNPR